MNKSKSKNAKAKVNINEILRIGSVLERTNMQQRNREAFDWLAENRDQMDDDPKQFADHLIAAIGDLVMSRELVKKVAKKLIKEGIITSNEYDKHFRHFEGSSNEHLPTVTLISYILKENCTYFQLVEIQ